MKPLYVLFILICCFFLLAPADGRKNHSGVSENPPAAKDPDPSDEPSKELLELLLRVCDGVERLNSTGESPEAGGVIRNDISELLKKAASLTSDEKVRLYFSSLSQDILKNDFSPSNTNWNTLKNRTGNLIIRKQADPKKMDCYVLKMNREWTQKAGQYLSLVEKMKSNTTLKSSRSGLQVKIVYPFIVADLIVSTGTTRLSLFHPADLAGPESEPSKIIIFSNLARLFFDRILKPVGLRVFGDTEGRSVRFDAYMSNLIMHKIAHFLGPFAVNAKSENLILVNSKLGDQFGCLEAIKADTVALSNTQVLIKAKLLSRKQEKRLLSTYVARLLDQSRGEAQSLSRLSALIQLHFFLNNQGIVFNVESDTLALNLEKLKENVKKLMTMVLNIQNSGSSAGAKQLIKQYSDIPEVLKRLVDKTADIPLSMDMEKKPDHP